MKRMWGLMVGFLVGAACVVAAIVMAFIFCGCASTSAIKTCANGDRWEVRSNRFLWQTEYVRVKAPDGTEVEVRQTQTDTEAVTASAGAIGAIVGAAVKTAVK
jgi:hypothetical protein